MLRHCFLFVCLSLLPLKPQLHAHPFYVGVTELNVLEGGLELSVRLFTDDLEAALDAFGAYEGIDLMRHQPTALIDSLLPAYLAAKMDIRANGAGLRFTYIGYEIEMDACWMHLEAKLKPGVQRLSVDAQWLYELFPSQQHIVHLAQGAARKSTRLTRHEKPWEVKLPI